MGNTVSKTARISSTVRMDTDALENHTAASADSWLVRAGSGGLNGHRVP